MNQPQFRGTGVALVTPFQHKAIDYPALAAIIEHCIAGGVDYIVCLGTTGEAITLSAQECREVLSFTVAAVTGRVPVVAGFFGGNYTDKLAQQLRAYDFTGVAAIMSSSPAYSKPNQEGIYQHYMAIAEASPLPVIIYNVPSRTGSNVLPSTILRLAEASPLFAGVKEASGDLCQAMQIIKHRPPYFGVYCGDDVLALPMAAAGADGAISVIANAYPDHFSGMVRAALAGNLSTARQLNELLLDVHPWLYIEGNPVGIKAAMEILGHCSREVRVPLWPLSDASAERLREAMSEVGALV